MVNNSGTVVVHQFYTDNSKKEMQVVPALIRLFLIISPCVETTTHVYNYIIGPKYFITNNNGTFKIRSGISETVNPITLYYYLHRKFLLEGVT